MNTRVSKIYFLVPLFYIGLILLLLYLQFAREEPFHFRYGVMRINGEVITGRSNPPALGSIELEVKGLTFAFSRTTPVRVDPVTGPEQTVTIKSYSTHLNGLQLTFTGGLALRFEVGGAAKQVLTITPVIPRGIEIASVSFPYRVEKAARTREATGVPALAVTRDEAGSAQTFILSLPYRSEIRPSESRLLLTATGGKFGPAVYGPAERPGQDPVVYWFEQNGNLPDAAAYDKRVKAYLDKAWQGWTATRFDETTGTWQMRDGSPAFSESVVAALLSQALSRGSYGTWLTTMQKAASLHAQDITRELSPYFGDLRQTYSAYAPQLSRELQRYRAGLESGASSVLSTPGLLRFVTDHADEATIQLLLSKLRAPITRGIGSATAVALLGDDLEASALGYTDPSYKANATQLVDREILPSIIRTESGFFLQSEAGTSDVANSVFAGSLLIKAGGELHDPTFAGIGRQLVLSSLALSDNEGFLPGRLTITGDAISASEGFLAPEKLYRWIAPDSYFPREISLAAKLGRGSWVWTASRVASVSVTANEVAIALDFSTGASGHAVFHGIKPFNSVRLYGAPWHADPAFEQYRAGWFYDAKDETLFVKLRHDAQKETIDIIY